MYICMYKIYIIYINIYYTYINIYNIYINIIYIYKCIKCVYLHISPGDNTPRDSNYTDTCPPSQKLYKFDEPDTRDTAGEARTSS